MSKYARSMKDAAKQREQADVDQLARGGTCRGVVRGRASRAHETAAIHLAHGCLANISPTLFSRPFATLLCHCAFTFTLPIALPPHRPRVLPYSLRALCISDAKSSPICERDCTLSLSQKRKRESERKKETEKPKEVGREKCLLTIR